MRLVRLEDCEAPANEGQLGEAPAQLPAEVEAAIDVMLGLDDFAVSPERAFPPAPLFLFTLSPSESSPFFPFPRHRGARARASPHFSLTPMATATRQRAGHSVPGHRSPVHGPTRAPTFLLRSTQLQQLIGFLKTPKGLDLFRRSFAENMMYKVSKYRELLTEAERESEHQIEVIDIRVADLRRRAKVSEDTCNWEIFESVSAGYREAMERAARLAELDGAIEAPVEGLGEPGG